MGAILERFTVWYSYVWNVYNYGKFTIFVQKGHLLVMESYNLTCNQIIFTLHVAGLNHSC